MPSMSGARPRGACVVKKALVVACVSLPIQTTGNRIAREAIVHRAHGWRDADDKALTRHVLPIHASSSGYISTWLLLALGLSPSKTVCTSMSAADEEADALRKPDDHLAPVLYLSDYAAQ
jgi:hypothetical protein